MLDSKNDILGDIPRGVPSRYINEQEPPLAYWQPPQKIMTTQKLHYNPHNPGKKILMGALGNKLIGIEDNRHILTVAGNRSGKSITVIANMFFYRGSVLAVDPKGELASKTAKTRAKMGQKVCILDPFNYCDASLNILKSGYNPMSVLKIESPTIIEDASIIAEAIVIKDSNKDSYWDNCAKSFIEGIILFVATNPAFKNNVNLVTVWELINDALMPISENTGSKPAYVLEQAMQESAILLSQIPSLQDIG